MKSKAILVQSVSRFFGVDLFADLGPHSGGKLRHACKYNLVYILQVNG